MKKKVKFNDVKAEKAVVNCVKKMSDLDKGPTDPLIFPKICEYLKIRKTLREKFRGNLSLAWRTDLRDFRKRVQVGIEKKLKTKKAQKSQSKYGVRVEDCSSDEENGGSQRQTSTSETSSVSSSEEEPLQNDKVTKYDYNVQQSLQIPLNKIVRDDRISNSLLHTHLREILPKELGISCVLVFEGLKFLNHKKLRDYGRCKQPNCERKFKFNGIVKDSHFQLIIHSTSAKGVHTEPLVYQLCKEKRIDYKANLEHMKPSTMHCKLTNEMDVNLAGNEKNFQFTFSRKVLQTARSEKLGENDRHSNDAIDILQRILDYNNEHPYIRQLIAPFTIYLACQEQVEIIKNHKDLVLYFDATGSLVRKPSSDSKRVYYYAGVVVIGKKNYTVMALITNDHTAHSILLFLNFMKHYWSEAGVTWPAFKATVTDMSWASINAVISASNNLTVSEYLKIIYEELINNIPRPAHFTPHFTCYAHLMKMLSRHLRELKLNDNAITLSLEAMALITHSRDLPEMTNKVELLFIILLSPKRTDDVVKAIQQLNALLEVRREEFTMKKEREEEERQEEEETEPENLDDRVKKPNYQQSPFWNHFKIPHDKVKKRVQKFKQWEKDNEFTSVAFIDYLMKNVLPYAPFWTTLISPEKKHLVNNPVENHFRFTKIECEQNVKAGRFIDTNYKQVKAACTELSLQTPKNHLKKKTPQKRRNEPDDLKSEEYWNRGPARKRQKKGHSYQQGKNLKRIATEIVQKKLRFNSNHTIDDPNYYFLENSPRTHIVAINVDIYDSKKKISLMSEDYYTLFNSQWLTNFVIDHWMYTSIGSLKRENEVAYITCEKSKYILQGDSLSADFYISMRIILNDRKEIFLPCLIRGNHWIMIYVNITDAIIYYFDSANNVKRKEEVIKKRKTGENSDFYETSAINFIQFYEQMYPGSMRKWKRKQCQYPRQKDSFNCGIFVIHFMDEILRGKISSIDNLNPQEKREEMKHLILSRSCDVSEVCLYCGSEESETKRKTTWFLCSTCHRWAEFECLKYLNRKKKEMKKIYFVFNCLPCSKWLTSKDE